MTVEQTLAALIANAEWVAGIDVVRHYEDAAQAFCRETGIMAPGKARPEGWPEASDEDRRAWTAWHRARAVARLEAARLLSAEIAEARATLANERGEGVPPYEGWVWFSGRRDDPSRAETYASGRNWRNEAIGAEVRPAMEHPPGLPWWWGVGVGRVDSQGFAPAARAGIRAAHDAHVAKEPR